LAEVFRRVEDPGLLASLTAARGEQWAHEMYEAGMFDYSHGRAARRGGSIDPANVTTTPVDPNDPRRWENSWSLRCPTCGRNLQLSGERMRDVATRLHDAGVTVADVSLLDAML
jgi:hypothetical protein